MRRGPAIFLYAKGELIGEFANHHLESISSPLWIGERVAVNDPEAFLKWFDDRKIDSEWLDYARVAKGNEKKWLEAMPSAIQHRRQLVTRPDAPAQSLAVLRQDLARAMPDRDDRILALFAWFGSGAGPWSGYPRYENVAEELLLEYPTAELLPAIEGKELTAAQTEGVARLFASFTFSEARSNDIHMVPAQLKARLLEHSLASPDEDKRARARKAFGG